MTTFTRETAEINTYQSLTELVQNTHDEEQVVREIAMALRLELITTEQMETLVDMFELLTP